MRYFLLVGLALVATGCPYGYAYRTVPDGTTVQGLVSNTSQPDLVIALHAGRVERSTDGGTTWTADPAFAQVTGIAGSTSLVYALGAVTAASSEEVFTSIDGGVNFAPASALPMSVMGTAPATIASSPSDAKHAVVAILGSTSTQIAATFDGGATWTQSSVAGLGSTSLTYRLGPQASAFDIGNPNRVYVALYGALLRSTDGGRTFSPELSNLTSSTAPSLQSVAALGSSVYLGTAEGLLVSTDDGATFTRRTLPSVTSATVGGVAIDPSNPLRIYVGTSFGTFRSTDGGTTFTLLYPQLGGPILVNGNVIFLSGVPYFGGVGARSVDGGATFRVFGGFDWAPLISIPI